MNERWKVKGGKRCIEEGKGQVDQINEREVKLR